MTKMPDVAKRLKDALDGLPLHMKGVSDMYRKHALKTGTTRSSIEGTDRAADLIARQGKHLLQQKRAGKTLAKPKRYLPERYIDEHNHNFDGGIARFQSLEDYNKYGPFRSDGDGYGFVLPKDEVHRIVGKADGDLRVIESELGLPEGMLDPGPVIVVDFPNADSSHVEMPSGNETGASDLWIPYGYTDGGVAEAVIHQDSAGAAGHHIRRDDDGSMITIG